MALIYKCRARELVSSNNLRLVYVVCHCRRDICRARRWHGHRRAWRHYCLIVNVHVVIEIQSNWLLNDPVDEARLNNFFSVLASLFKEGIHVKMGFKFLRRSFIMVGQFWIEVWFFILFLLLKFAENFFDRRTWIN